MESKDEIPKTDYPSLEKEHEDFCDYANLTEMKRKWCWFKKNYKIQNYLQWSLYLVIYLFFFNFYFLMILNTAAYKQTVIQTLMSVWFGVFLFIHFFYYFNMFDCCFLFNIWFHTILVTIFLQCISHYLDQIIIKAHQTIRLNCRQHHVFLSSSISSYSVNFC